MQTPHMGQATDRAAKQDLEGWQAYEGREPENAEIFKAGENLRIPGNADIGPSLER